MKTVAVIFGGRSTEHDVSIMTAISSIIRPLELTNKFKVEAVYISKDGKWFWDDKLKNIKLFQTGEIDEFMQKAPTVQISFDDGLVIVKSSQFAGRKKYKKIDAVFPAMHGTHGEDGELMGILEMANVAYVGCDPRASAVAMDKVLSKQVTGYEGIKSTPWVWFYSKDLARKHPEIVKKIETLKYPLFVKPAHLGSSIGISKVDNPDQLMNALEVAAHYDDKVIVEQAVDNLIEVTLPIIGNHELTPALVEQPLVSAEDFFDFDTKYMKGGKGKKSGGQKGIHGYSNLPAKISDELYEESEKMALEVYRVVGCSGIARVDMLIDEKTKEIYFNEINPLPGDLYAHNWRAAGKPQVDLVQELLALAESRWKENNMKTTTFSTNYLKQF
jgi:D-alanine-D-alanine ligase